MRELLTVYSVHHRWWWYITFSAVYNVQMYTLSFTTIMYEIAHFVLSLIAISSKSHHANYCDMFGQNFFRTFKVVGIEKVFGATDSIVSITNVNMFLLLLFAQ